MTTADVGQQAPESTSTPTVTPDPSSAPPEALSRSERILIVDDDDLVRKAMARVLTRFGYDVVACSDAEEAMEAAERFSFDALVTDLVLPGLDGVELIEKLQENGNQIPVVLVSGYPDPKRPVDGLAAGAHCFITKPVPSGVLAMTLSRAIRQANNNR
jgi:two-component system response regulator TctD